MIDAAVLRGWLLQQPRPAIVRLTAADGAQMQEIDCTATRSWAALAQSCVAVDPTLLECLDAGRKLLRAVRPDELEQSTGSSSSQGMAASSSRSDDPETARFKLFAQLLAEAYRHSNEVAFAKLVELYEAQVNSARQTNKEVENLLKLLRREWEEKLAAAEEQQEDPLTAAASAFLAGAQQGAVAPNSNGKG
jgi:hypothetical protein